MRYSAVDFFRGLTIAFMIIVNTPGNWTHVYPPLRHAVWHGFTPTDLVFPSFMYIIGVSMWFAFAKFDRRWSPEAGRKILRRTILLFGVGLILNNFPFLWKNWDTWRIMGVPQRLALGYGIASVLVLNLGRRALIGTSCVTARDSMSLPTNSLSALETSSWGTHPRYVLLVGPTRATPRRRSRPRRRDSSATTAGSCRPTGQPRRPARRCR